MLFMNVGCREAHQPSGASLTLPETLNDIRSRADLERDPRFGKLMAFVDTRRNGRRWSSRANIDPAEIPALLPNLWLIEIESDKRRAEDPCLRVRLAGTQIERIYGKSLNKTYLESLDWGNHSGRIFNSLNRMADEGIGHYLDATAIIQPRVSRRVRRLGLPLSDDQARVSHLLLLAYYEFHTHAPERYDEFWIETEETGRAP